MENLQKPNKDDYLKIVAELQALADDALDICNIVENSDHVEHKFKEIQLRIDEISDLLRTIEKIKRVTG